MQSDGKTMQIQERYKLPEGEFTFTIKIVGESNIIKALQKKVISQAERILHLEQKLEVCGALEANDRN